MRQTFVALLAWLVGGALLLSPVVPGHLPYAKSTFAQHHTVAGNSLLGEAPTGPEEFEEKRKRLSKQRFLLVHEDSQSISRRAAAGGPLSYEVSTLPVFLRCHTLKRFVPSDEPDYTLI